MELLMCASEQQTNRLNYRLNQQLVEKKLVAHGSFGTHAGPLIRKEKVGQHEPHLKQIIPEPLQPPWAPPSFCGVAAAAVRAVTSLPVVTQPLSRAPITASHCLLHGRPGHVW